MTQSKERLAFKNITKDDIDVSYKLHIEYIDYVNSVGENINYTPYESHKSFVLKFLGEPKNHPFKHWYIVNYNNKQIGYMVIKKSGEFGYVIFKKYRGKGIGNLMFEKFFKIHPKHTVWARTKLGNKRSQKMLEKYGFVKTDLEYH